MGLCELLLLMREEPQGAGSEGGEGPPAGEGAEAITTEGRAMPSQEEPLGMRTKKTDLEGNEGLSYPPEGPGVF